MKNTSITSNNLITDGQKKQYKRFVEDATNRGVELALEKVRLDKTGFQRLLENGDEFNSAIAEVIVAKTRELSVSNRFADEEVTSKYGYLSGYKNPKGITEQTNILRQLLPGYRICRRKDRQPSRVPEGAEGWFAIPKWQSVAPTYGEAVQKVLDLIKKTRDGKFYNYREGQLGPKNLRQSEKSA